MFRRPRTNVQSMERHRGWTYVATVVAAIFSAIFSGIFLVVASVAPRWDKVIGKQGVLNEAAVNVITQLFAKLIEVTFVTTCLGALGQLLSRRAAKPASTSTRLSDIYMRNWIVQPGTLFTHWSPVRISGPTMLGIFALLAAVLSLLYTTAASALVVPVLRDLPRQHRSFSAFVRGSYANIIVLRKTCTTPIPVSAGNYSLEIVGHTCLEMLWAGLGFASVEGHSRKWTQALNAGRAMSTNLLERPAGFEILESNTAVTSSWLSAQDYTSNYETYGRIIDNITLAVPHPSMLTAVQDPANGLLQTGDLNGQASYQLRAALPSPYINVLCANANRSDLIDMVYETQPGVSLNMTQDFSELSTWWFRKGMDWARFGTAQSPLDDIFGWNDNPTARPAFYKFPVRFNTVVNTTRRVYGERDELYILGKTDPDFSWDEYFVCAARSGITPACSSEYAATAGGNTLAVHCEDPTDELRFASQRRHLPFTRSLDWFDIGASVLTSQNLGTGVTDGSSAASRYLTQTVLLEPSLSRTLPSPGEVLASLLAPSIWASAKGTPVTGVWNYTVPELSTGASQWFEGELTTIGYMSGGNSAYQRSFYIVLAAVFVMSVLLATYLIRLGGLVIDMTEIDGLFVLAMASPPSNVIKQQASGEPAPFVYEAGWKLIPQGGHHVLVHANDLDEDNAKLELKTVPTEEIETTSRSALVDRRSIDEGSESMVSQLSHEDTQSLRGHTN